jgi:F-type H+-transporting ATPase subunit c
MTRTGRHNSRNEGFRRVDRIQLRHPPDRKETRTERSFIMAMPMLAEMGGSIHVGLAGLGSAIGVGLVGMKASEAVGRNPGAFGKIMTIGLIGMAFSEAIVFYALFLVH